MDVKTLAIIMDGNGRWAKSQGFLKRTIGHKEGVKAVRRITTYAAKMGVKNLILYAFSTENWKRPQREVDFLMDLLKKHLQDELEIYMENDIVFDYIGDVSVFSQDLIDLISTTKQKTSSNNGMRQILALNYGSHDEIIRATKKAPNEDFQNCLDFKEPVDMLIRTGGEMRLSNFLLWQVAYAELFFTPTLWPDFSEDELGKMLEEFSLRDRRFGGL